MDSPLAQLQVNELSEVVLIVSGWSGSSFRRSIMCFAGTAMRPSSAVFSTWIWVLRVSSESEAVISNTLSLRSKRKFSRIGRGDFAGMAFDTAITPLSSSELEMISFIIIVFNNINHVIYVAAHYGIIIQQI